MDITYLREINYPHENVPLWAITAEEVENLFSQGITPQIRLPDLDYTNKPRIAVILAQDKHPDREKEDYTIFPDYVDAIVASGGVPVFIVYDYVYRQLELTLPDGMMLIGGNFRLVKKHPHATWERRPHAYVRMIKYAMQNNLPTFAICGGMQMLGVYKGCGVQTEINKNVLPEKSHLQKPYELSHSITLQKGSLINRILCQEKIMVNSCHNTVLLENKRSDCLVVGKAEDGTVEAVEHAHPWSDFVLSVQWHPERLFKIGDENAKTLFAAFIDAATKYHQKITGY